MACRASATLSPAWGSRRGSASRTRRRPKARSSAASASSSPASGPASRFSDLDDLNAQALAWCDRLNGQPHATTRVPPRTRWAAEGLRPLPTDWAWERFAAEERRVSWDGYVSYDGVLYGLPASPPGMPPLAGATVQVRERAGQVRIWSGGQRVLRRRQARPVPREIVPHPDQFRGVAPAASARHAATPLGHRVPAPSVARRDLREYDRL